MIKMDFGDFQRILKIFRVWRRGIAILLLIELRSLVTAQQGQELSIEERRRILIENDVIPNITSSVPADVNKVVFPTTNYIPHYTLNGIATREETALEPIEVSFPYDSDDLYILIMLGDIPTVLRGLLPGQVLHWMVCNIPEGDFKKGDLGAFYLFPTPPTPERYVYKILIYKQSGRIDCSALQMILRIPERLNFFVKNFKEVHNLEGPLAIQLFQCCFPFETLGLLPIPGLSNQSVTNSLHQASDIQ